MKKDNRNTNAQSPENCGAGEELRKIMLVDTIKDASNEKYLFCVNSLLTKYVRIIIPIENKTDER